VRGSIETPSQQKLDRTVLPIAEPKPPTYSELAARKESSVLKASEYSA
jgi:hypothetical protein